MSRFFALLNLAALLSFGVPAAWAEDSRTLQEVRDLRALVEKQSKQIDVLTEQLAKLRLALENAHNSGATPVPVATPVAAPAASPEFSTNSAKAEPADGKRHVVVKGETFTSIAKQYGIAITELKKANKDVDERKLQIGQTLTIPTPKVSEAPTEKKETP
ncbi:MAG: hypothetical protein QOE70_6039 [Chthoniobacter sp.]|jgi:LysM repeat protein|nr:hypothetical protein [Chthoniobacter sp.]